MDFTLEPFQQLLVLNRIKHERSASYSLHQNGTVEWSWRTLFSMTRCLLIKSKLPKNLCVYALIASVYIRNRCYNKKHKKNPIWKFHQFKTIFGICFSYAQNKMKLEPHCETGIFVGYDKQSPPYLIYFPETMAI